MDDKVLNSLTRLNTDKAILETEALVEAAALLLKDLKARGVEAAVIHGDRGVCEKARRLGDIITKLELLGNLAN